MEMLTKETMTVQALIELAKLSVDQTIKYLDHANYQLRGSQMVVLDNLNIIDGAGYNSPLETQLMDMRSSELATVITTTHGIVYLKEDMVILIFKDGKPTYAMYGLPDIIIILIRFPVSVFFKSFAINHIIVILFTKEIGYN